MRSLPLLVLAFVLLASTATYAMDDDITRVAPKPDEQKPQEEQGEFTDFPEDRFDLTIKLPPKASLDFKDRKKWLRVNDVSPQTPVKELWSTILDKLASNPDGKKTDWLVAVDKQEGLRFVPQSKYASPASGGYVSLHEPGLDLESSAPIGSFGMFKGRGHDEATIAFKDAGLKGGAWGGKNCDPSVFGFLASLQRQWGQEFGQGQETHDRGHGCGVTIFPVDGGLEAGVRSLAGPRVQAVGLTARHCIMEPESNPRDRLFIGKMNYWVAHGDHRLGRNWAHSTSKQKFEIFGYSAGLGSYGSGGDVALLYLGNYVEQEPVVSRADRGRTELQKEYAEIRRYAPSIAGNVCEGLDQKACTGDRRLKATCRWSSKNFLQKMVGKKDRCKLVKGRTLTAAGWGIASKYFHGGEWGKTAAGQQDMQNTNPTRQNLQCVAGVAEKWPNSFAEGRGVQVSVQAPAGSGINQGDSGGTIVYSDDPYNIVGLVSTGNHMGGGVFGSISNWQSLYSMKTSSFRALCHGFRKYVWTKNSKTKKNKNNNNNDDDKKEEEDGGEEDENDEDPIGGKTFKKRCDEAAGDPGVAGHDFYEYSNAAGSVADKWPDVPRAVPRGGGGGGGGGGVRRRGGGREVIVPGHDGDGGGGGGAARRRPAPPPADTIRWVDNPGFGGGVRHGGRGIRHGGDTRRGGFGARDSRVPPGGWGRVPPGGWVPQPRVPQPRVPQPRVPQPHQPHFLPPGWDTHGFRPAPRAPPRGVPRGSQWAGDRWIDPRGDHWIVSSPDPAKPPTHKTAAEVASGAVPPPPPPPHKKTAAAAAAAASSEGAEPAKKAAKKAP